VFPSALTAVRSDRRAFRTILPIFGILRALMRDPVEREFLLGFWKIHILHHAEKHGVYGQWMLEELRHHGYHVSPGTMYPILNRMAQHGWIRAAEPDRTKAARVYRITPRGADVLRRIRESLGELSGEVGSTRAPRHADREDAPAPRTRRAAVRRTIPSRR
jgi:PadR family transcriptional regulator PadR